MSAVSTPEAGGAQATGERRVPTSSPHAETLRLVRPYPLGSVRRDDGSNFAVFSENAPSS